MARAPLIRQDFVLAASQFRVWDLLAGTILQSMPVEQTQIVDDSTMTGVLKLKLGFVRIPLRLKMEVADVSPMDSFSSLVTVGTGPIQSTLRVTYALKALDDDETAVVCAATVESAPAWMALTTWQQRSFARKMFDDIRAALERAI